MKIVEKKLMKYFNENYPYDMKGYWDFFEVKKSPIDRPSVKIGKKIYIFQKSDLVSKCAPLPDYCIYL